MKVRKEKLYWAPATTVDVVIFSVQEDKLKVLLLERANEPFKDHHTLLGGGLVKNESSEKVIERILKEKVGIKGVYTEQLYTLDNLSCDLRGHVLTIAYFTLFSVSMLKIRSDEREHFQLFSLEKLPKLAFDHKRIIECVLERLRTNLEYTNVVYSLLPNGFTMPQLRKIYEIVLGKKLDKRNFNKKFLSFGIVKETGKKLGGSCRHPA